MADLGGAINVDEQVKEYRGDFTVLPPGWYQAVIVKSEVKATKAGDGKYLELTFRTTKDNVDIVERLNIVNPSDVAQRIGRATLAKIAHDMGITGQLTDSNVLHGRPIDIKVKIETFTSNTTGNELQSNRICDYRKTGTGRRQPGGEHRSAAGWDTVDDGAGGWGNGGGPGGGAGQERGSQATPW